MEQKSVSKIKSRLIQEAIMLYGEVTPCAKASEWDESFTYDNNMVILWFNSPDQTTRVLTAHISDDPDPKR